MTILDHKQTSGQERQSPHSDVQRYNIPLYIPGLAPSDYHLFGLMKEGLRGKHYVSDEEVKTAVMKWLKEKSTEFYEARIHAIIRRRTLL